MIRIKGVAHPAEDLDSADWVLPDGQLPLRVEFDPIREIGTARLQREEDGSITCTAYIADELSPDYPKLAVAVVHAFNKRPELFAVSVVKEHRSPHVPPYSIMKDDSA